MVFVIKVELIFDKIECMFFILKGITIRKQCFVRLFHRSDNLVIGRFHFITGNFDENLLEYGEFLQFNLDKKIARPYQSKYEINSEMVDKFAHFPYWLDFDEWKDLKLSKVICDCKFFFFEQTKEAALTIILSLQNKLPAEIVEMIAKIVYNSYEDLRWIPEEFVDNEFRENKKLKCF